MNSAPISLPYSQTCPTSTDINNPYGSDPSGTRYLQGGATCVPFIVSGTLVPSAPVGALLARIGTSGTWTVVGAHFQGPAWNSGRLFLIMNDSVWDDNSGIYKVVVTVG
jgi:hypothetical protein